MAVAACNLTRVREITDNHKFIAAGLKRHLIRVTSYKAYLVDVPGNHSSSSVCSPSWGALLLFSETFLVPLTSDRHPYPIVVISAAAAAHMRLTVAPPRQEGTVNLN